MNGVVGIVIESVHGVATRREVELIGDRSWNQFGHSRKLVTISGFFLLVEGSCDVAIKVVHHDLESFFLLALGRLTKIGGKEFVAVVGQIDVPMISSDRTKNVGSAVEEVVEILHFRGPSIAVRSELLLRKQEVLPGEHHHLHFQIHVCCVFEDFRDDVEQSGSSASFDHHFVRKHEQAGLGKDERVEIFVASVPDDGTLRQRANILPSFLRQARSPSGAEAFSMKSISSLFSGPSKPEGDTELHCTVIYPVTNVRIFPYQGGIR